MTDQIEFPKIYSISTGSRKDLIEIPNYLYPLWSVMLLQLIAEGHMDDQLTNLFDMQLRIAVHKLAVVVEELRVEDIPF